MTIADRARARASRQAAGGRRQAAGGSGLNRFTGRVHSGTSRRGAYAAAQVIPVRNDVTQGSHHQRAGAMVCSCNRDAASAAAPNVQSGARDDRRPIRDRRTTIREGSSAPRR